MTQAIRTEGPLRHWSALSGWICRALLVFCALLASWQVRDAAAWAQAANTSPMGQPAAVADTPLSEFQDHVVVVLDASGSMKARMRSSRLSRMQAAKLALKTVTANVSPQTKMGLLVFSAANLHDDWAYPLGQVDQERLHQAIDLPQPGGATPLGLYLKKATDTLLEERKRQHGFGTYRLLIVTDGQATDPQLLDRYLPEVLARGIVVDCIGVDMDSDHALATRVHSYRRADSPEQLVTAVSDVFAEVGSRAGDTTQSEADFAAIASLPDEMAVAMLSALTRTDDHPIGEEPPSPAWPTDLATGGKTLPGSSSPPTSQPVPSAPARVGKFAAVLAAITTLPCVMLTFFVLLMVWLLRRSGSRPQPMARRRR